MAHPDARGRTHVCRAGHSKVWHRLAAVPKVHTLGFLNPKHPYTNYQQLEQTLRRTGEGPLFLGWMDGLPLAGGSAQRTAMPTYTFGIKLAEQMVTRQRSPMPSILAPATWRSRLLAATSMLLARELLGPTCNCCQLTSIHLPVRH